MRSPARLAILCFALLSLTAAAHAGGLAPASHGGVLQRLGGWVARQLTLRPEVVQTTKDAAALRKEGELVKAADRLRTGDDAVGLRERVRLWRARKALIAAARRNFSARSIDADPAEGERALHRLGRAGLLSKLDVIRAGIALAGSARNALRSARRLGNADRFDDALDMLEWARGDHGEVSAKALAVSKRLSEQAMKAAHRVAKQYARAEDEPARAAIFQRASLLLGESAAFGEIYARDFKEQGAFDENRAGRVARAMQHTLDDVDAEVARQAKASDENAPPPPAATVLSAAKHDAAPRVAQATAPPEPQPSSQQRAPQATRAHWQYFYK